MILKKIHLPPLLVLIFLLSGCASAITTPPPDPKIPLFETKQEQLWRQSAEETALNFLADQLGLEPAELQVAYSEAAHWSNACLDVEENSEYCPSDEIDGFLVFINSPYDVFEVHTNEDASIIELSYLNNPSKNVVGASIQYIADQFDLPEHEIHVRSIEYRNWQNTCLEIRDNDQCQNETTPGFKISLNARDLEYIVHTNMDATTILSAANDSLMMNPILIWQASTEPCIIMQFDEHQMQHGPCDGNLTSIPYPDASYASQLLTFQKTYEPFSAQLTLGYLTLNGIGSLPPLELHMNEMSAWAEDTYLELTEVENE